MRVFRKTLCLDDVQESLPPSIFLGYRGHMDDPGIVDKDIKASPLHFDGLHGRLPAVLV